jgi:hypothetical protein
MAKALVLRRWKFLFYFKGTLSWILQKRFPPLEPRLLVLWERIGEVLHIV